MGIKLENMKTLSKITYLVLPSLDIGKDLNYPFTLELYGVCTGEGWNGTGMMGCFLVGFLWSLLSNAAGEVLITELEKMWVLPGWCCSWWAPKLEGSGGISCFGAQSLMYVLGRTWKGLEKESPYISPWKTAEHVSEF